MSTTKAAAKVTSFDASGVKASFTEGEVHYLGR
jgi:hypothetical protein